MDKSGRGGIRSAIANRTVAWVFGILAVFVLVLQAIRLLELDPFANLVVRILLLPGYVVMLGYAVFLVSLFRTLGLSPEVGQVGWLLGLVIYLYIVSVIIVGVYRTVR